MVVVHLPVKKTCYYICRVAAWAALCLLFLFLGGCAPAGAQRAIVCDSGENSLYSEIISKVLPSFRVIADQGSRTPFSLLEAGHVAEAFDAQAVSALEGGLAGYWYPHYLATAVIAVDRDRTGAPIGSWTDLLSVKESVGYSDEYPDGHFLMAALAYGLEGENFTLKKAAGLLRTLHTEKRLALRTVDAPIVICYDYQAAALIRSGRNMEVIVPHEGTLTYRKGLLSGRELHFAGHAEPLLLSAGFRLPGGNCNAALYPAAADYGNAAAVADYAHLNSVLQDVTRVFQRRVLHNCFYCSADSREHQLFALLYIIILVIWTASMIRRAMQKGVLRAALATGIILLGWITLRLIKYQLVKTEMLTRHLWYSYYLFQLALPLALLWLAWAIDKPEDRLVFPRWLALPAAINGMLAAVILTNDLHNWVFRLDPGSPNWPTEYTYGPAFFLLSAVWVAQIIIIFAVLAVKSRRNLRKGAFVFPLVFCTLLSLYAAGYIMRVPIAWESSYTMVIGLFTLLFFEVFMRTGLVPVNTKYARLFAHSPLKMQIIDGAGAVALSSAAAGAVERSLLQSALASYPLPAEQDRDTLLFATAIVGGSALWQEDISSLNRLHGEVEESVRSLAAANTVLAGEKKIRQALAEERAKTQLMVQLENEIAPHIRRLSAMIEALDSSAGDQLREAGRIALTLCYLKRRSNLFFRERETEALLADELVIYIDELAGMADHAGAKILVTGDIEQAVPVRRATLFYDFFYAVVDEAVKRGPLRMLAHLGSENEKMILRLLLPEEGPPFELKKDLGAALAAAGAIFSIRDLEGATGISLAFPEGGGAHG